MKSRHKYRIYPTDQQKNLLAQLFGCVRVVWNDALYFCKKLYEETKTYKNYGFLCKEILTKAKKTEKREWLGSVSSVPLQQSLKDLDLGFKNFFDSCSGKRKGAKVSLPKFKKRKSTQSARFNSNAFKLKESKVYLAKIGDLKVVWSRPLPSTPTSVTVIKDAADRYFLSFVVEINPLPLPDNGLSIGVDFGIIVRVVGVTHWDNTLESAPHHLHVVNREDSVSQNRENLFVMKVKVLPPRHQVESIVSSGWRPVIPTAEAALKTVNLLAENGITMSNWLWIAKANVCKPSLLKSWEMANTQRSKYGQREMGVTDIMMSVTMLPSLGGLNNPKAKNYDKQERLKKWGSSLIRSMIRVVTRKETPYFRDVRTSKSHLVMRWIG